MNLVKEEYSGPLTGAMVTLVHYCLQFFEEEMIP